MKHEAGISTNPATWGEAEATAAAAEPEDEDKATSTNWPRPRANFKGKTEELGGMIFELGEGTKQITSYNDAVDKIQWYFSVQMSKEGGSRIAQCIFDNLAEPKFDKPKALPATVTPMELHEQKQVATRAFNEKVKFDENRQVLYALTWGQCTDAVRS